MDNEKGYKAFNPGMICNDKQYAENNDYEEVGGNICEKGMMHYCCLLYTSPSPRDS